MAHLYLIRRDNREYIGPLSIQELRSRLLRMEFGMQDEVSGHCGPWVVLDKQEDMSNYYPEISTIIVNELPFSWREATGHAKVISKHESRRDRAKIKQAEKSKNSMREYLERQKRRSQIIKISSITLILIAIISAALILSRKDDLPNVNDLSTLASKSDSTEFLSIMGMKVIPNVSKIVKSQKNINSWLPLLRFYAYSSTGAIEGVPPKLLRGDVAANAPADCSVESWKKRWRETESQILQTMQGGAFYKNQWTKILFMDSHWVKRRFGKTWTKPRNYFEGCLLMASVGLRSLASEQDFGGSARDGKTSEWVAMISRRLQNQLEIIATGKATVGNVGQSNGILDHLTCIENAASLAEIDACASNFEAAFKPVADERRALALLRLAIQGAVEISSPTMLTETQSAMAKVANEDAVSKLDQAPEVKFLGYLAGGTPVEQAIVKIEQEYADLKWR